MKTETMYLIRQCMGTNPHQWNQTYIYATTFCEKLQLRLAVWLMKGLPMKQFTLTETEGTA